MKLKIIALFIILNFGCATFILWYDKPLPSDYLDKIDIPDQRLWNNVYVGLDNAYKYEDSSFHYSFWQIHFYTGELIKADMMGHQTKAPFHSLKFISIDTSYMENAYCQNKANDSFLLSATYGYKGGGYYILDYGVKILSADKLRMHLLTFRNFNKHPRFKPPKASFARIIYLKRVKDGSIEAE